MLILFRHGETAYNDPPEKFRGTSSVQIEKSAEVTVRETAIDVLRLHQPVLKIYASDVRRSAQTAAIVSEVTKAKIVETRGLEDWDYGDLTGKRVDENLDIIKEYENECHDKALPGGEAYDTFLKRLLPFVQKAIDEDGDKGIVVLVTHNRVIRTILAWIKAGRKGIEVDKDTLNQKKDPILPGHMKVLKVV